MSRSYARRRRRPDPVEDEGSNRTPRPAPAGEAARSDQSRLAATGPEISAFLGGAPRQQPSTVLALQRSVGNRAVIHRLMYAEGKDQSGKTLEPMAVNHGTGTHNNLKWNKGGGKSGAGKYNTGFWRVQSDPTLELHVHFGNGGGLVAAGGVANHFKRGADQKGSASNSDLEKVFGSQTVTGWTKAAYKM